MNPSGSPLSLLRKGIAFFRAGYPGAAPRQGHNAALALLPPAKGVSFDPTPNGTRGARQPGAGRVMRWINNWAAGRIRKGGKFMGAAEGLVLTTVGRKTGTERSTPVNWFPGADGSWLIVASAAGAPKHPAWYYNIAANPDSVWIETSDGKVAVIAEQLRGTDRDQAWNQITSASSLFAKYQKKTDRELPVIRLTRRADS